MKRFNGTRIKSARLYNGLTVEELAEIIGVSKQAVSQYENNQVDLPLEKVFLLSNALNFPVDYFAQANLNNVQIGTTYFRALLRTNSKTRTQQETRLEHLGIIYSFINQYVDFPALDLPVFQSELPPKEAAIELRKYWGLGNRPIDNITQLLESKGILITALETSTQDIDAFGQRECIDGKEVYFIAVSKETHSAARFQFDIAHELGHIILHEWSENLELLSREQFKSREKEANEFASEFLLPSAAYLNDVIGIPNRVESYIPLKRKWKVSIGAMAYKNRELGIISQRQYQYLISIMNKQNIKIIEPLDDVLPIPLPSMFDDAVTLLLEEKVFTPATFIDALSAYGLSMNYAEVESLLNLPNGKLKPNYAGANSKSIKLKL